MYIGTHATRNSSRQLGPGWWSQRWPINPPNQVTAENRLGSETHSLELVVHGEYVLIIAIIMMTLMSIIIIIIIMTATMMTIHSKQCHSGGWWQALGFYNGWLWWLSQGRQVAKGQERHGDCCTVVALLNSCTAAQLHSRDTGIAL